MEFILCAAIWYQDEIKHEAQPENIELGYVWCGWRHENIIVLRHLLLQKSTVKASSVNGFLTSSNRFVDRVDAMEIAIKAGQLEKEFYPGKLTSLHLY